MRSCLKEHVDAATRPRKRPPLHYAVDTATLSAPLSSTFVLSECDAGTSEWLATAAQPSAWKQWFASLLTTCFSRTTANGIAHRGGMHVLSTSQASSLLSGLLPPPREAHQGLILLDIGAGDGGVTIKLRHFFSRVFATEASASMRWRLKQHGFVVSEMPNPALTYDCVALFNVLDRCDKPLSLLRDVVDTYLSPGGVALIAVVLPWCPFVEDGTKKRSPTQVIPMGGARCGDKPTFEACCNIFAEQALVASGLVVERWTRVPYLCEGSTSTHEYYTLDNAVFACRKRQ